MLRLISKRALPPSLLQRHIPLLSASFHTTTPTLKKKDDDDDDDNDFDDSELWDPSRKYETLNADKYTEAEIQAIIDESVAELEAEKERKLYKDWKPGMRKRPLQISYREEDFYDEISDRVRWTPKDRRCGALGIKLGMMPVWDYWGEQFPCTVLWLDSNVVMQVMTKEKHGYDAVQIGAGERKKKNVTKPLLCHYKTLGIPWVEDHPPHIVREFRINRPELATPKIGTRIHASHFVPGQNLDVAGISKGKGFQGGMKRHGFAGMPATHGTSRSHRALGSTGMCQDPGRVFKGKKMAGRMGCDRVTVQNLRLLKIDRGKDLLYVKGHVPGNRGGFVEIKDAIKKPLFGTEMVVGGEEENGEFPPLPTFEYEEEIDGSGKDGFEIFMPNNKIDPFAIEDETG